MFKVKGLTTTDKQVTLADYAQTTLQIGEIMAEGPELRVIFENISGGLVTAAKVHGEMVFSRLSLKELSSTSKSKLLTSFHSDNCTPTIITGDFNNKGLPLQVAFVRPLSQTLR